MGVTLHRRAMLAAAAAALGGAVALPGRTIARAKAAGAKAAEAKAEARDLTGVWTNAWYTWLERPKELKTLVVTPAEAAAYEHPRRALHGELASKEDLLGQNESEFPDNGPGLARIGGQIRSSWIVDPPDGKIPWIPAMRKALRIGLPPAETYDNVEQRDTDERCLTSASGAAPLVNSHDANLIQIVQAPGWLAIVGERDHETRIVQVRAAGARGPVPPALGNWMGVSVGHWEGATLVVATTGLRPGFTKIIDDFYLSDHARVTERFTRTGPGEIAYGFEVEDASLFTQPWRAEMVLRAAEGRMFEYACHEGNYSLPNILGAARAAEREAAARASVKAGPP